MRLDHYLMQEGLFESRHRAQIEIKAERILVNGKIITKPSYMLKPTDEIEILEPFNRYVSQGGLKLEKALDVFKIDVTGTHVLDVGASTGGFTDCLLEHGAKHVVALDVGRNQLHEKLRQDPRVFSMEESHFLSLQKDDITPVDLIVMDVSFISGIPLIHHAKELFNVAIIWLIKPQFETIKTPKSGVIKSPKLHLEVLESVQKSLNQDGLYIQNITVSPVKGQKGNIEFLAYINRNKTWISAQDIVKQAHHNT